MYSVLYVDDEQDVLDITRLFLEDGGTFRVETSPSAQTMLDSGRIGSFDAVITDYQMPGMNGIEFLKEIRKRYGEMPVVLYTGRGREEIAIEAINNGANSYVQKGGDPEVQYTELEHKTLQAIQKYRAERTLEHFRRVFSTMPVGLLLLDDKLRIEQASDTMTAMILREPSSVIGERAGAGLGCIHSSEVPQGCGFSNACPECPLQSGVRNVIATGERIRTKIISLNLRIGEQFSVRWLRISAEPVDIDNSRYVIVAIDDVTDLVSRHPEIVPAVERFGSLLNIADTGMLLAGIQDAGGSWEILEANDAACGLLCSSRDELLNRDFFELITALPEEKPVREHATALRENDEIRFRARLVRKDRTVLDAEVNAQVISRGIDPVALLLVRKRA